MNPTIRATTVVGLAIVCALGLSACQVWGPDQSVSAPTSDPSLTASISSPVVSPDGTISSTSFILFDCSKNVQFTGPLDIAMTAGQSVDLNQVAIRFVDSSLGQGPLNTFDQEDLVSAFGSTQIQGGAIRTFRFHTDLTCGRQGPQSIAADIRFVEASGRRNTTTVTAPFVMPCSDRTDRLCSPSGVRQPIATGLRFP